MTAGKIISDEFLICMKIFEFNEKKEKIWFSKLVEELGGDQYRIKISDCLDRLSDLGMIDGEWETVNGNWVRTLKVTEEFEGFIRGLYNTSGPAAEVRYGHQF